MDINQLHVVVGLGPVVPDEQHPRLLSIVNRTPSVGAVGGDLGDLMVQCSTGTSSHQPCNLLTNHRGHDLCLDLEGLGDPVLTR